jgi:type I restriction enzyme R subunit
MPPTTPESLARLTIDAALARAGWSVQDAATANLHAARGVAVREFPLKSGHGEADYLLFVNARAVGVVEAKKQGTPLTGVEIQSARYGAGLPDHLKAPVRPLPFLYESTGAETRFTNRLDPDPRSRPVFAFHQPATLAEWAERRRADSFISPISDRLVAEDRPRYDSRTSLRGRLRTMPPIVATGLWPAQLQAVRNLEASLRDDRPRALIQMATGSGKTFAAISAIYRLIKHADARRVLFLVDRANLGRQTLKEFQHYPTPDDGRVFTELYNVQHLSTNRIDSVSRVCITTIQRLYAMLSGRELDPADEEGSQFDSAAALLKEPVPITYNPAYPIELFDVIFTDEAHRSIYNLWRQVLEYFDAYLIGLTATPSKQTIAFFNQNLVMEYNHQQAVADGVNVDYDVYRIRTAITETGSRVEAGLVVDKRDRLTRKIRWEELDEDLAYDAAKLDRDVVAEDQIRTVVRTFKERLFTEIFPGRTEVPKTLIFAKDDSHADDVVKIVREEFGRGNDFCQKITYKTTGAKPEDLLASFRNSYNPRIVVTVDMIATGTDIKPLEIVMFMRSVKSRNFFEQMKGRGVRVIDQTDFRAVTPDAASKTHFVIVDCVGVCEAEKTDAPPLERQYTVAFDKLLQAVAFGSTDPDILSSLAGRLARLDRQLAKPERDALTAAADGLTLKDIAAAIVAALDPDAHVEAARLAHALPAGTDPTDAQIAAAAETLLERAALPLAANPDLRARILDTKQRHEQTIDKISSDVVLEAAFSAEAADRARSLVASFERFIAANRDEIAALQVLYSRPYRERLRLKDIRALADTLKAPPRAWTPEALWRAYETLDQSRVRGSGRRILTDLVSLVRYALHQDPELVPYPAHVETRFAAWLAHQESTGRRFTPEQCRWLEAIRDHVATSLRIDPDDFDYAPFAQNGGLGKVYELFGEDLYPLLDELNEVLAA